MKLKNKKNPKTLIVTNKNIEENFARKYKKLRGSYFFILKLKISFNFGIIQYFVRNSEFFFPPINTKLKKLGQKCPIFFFKFPRALHVLTGGKKKFRFPFLSTFLRQKVR